MCGAFTFTKMYVWAYTVCIQDYVFKLVKLVLFVLFSDFQMKVLMKLDKIIEYQEDILKNQRMTMSSNIVTEDILLDWPCESEEELQTLEKEVQDKVKRMKMVSHSISKYLEYPEIFPYIL